MPRLSRDQRGLSQSVQYAVIFPALMLTTLGIIQAGVWIHGEDVAQRAANAAADAARGSHGSPGAAQDLAQGLLRRAGSRVCASTSSGDRRGWTSRSRRRLR